MRTTSLIDSLLHKAGRDSLQPLPLSARLGRRESRQPRPLPPVVIVVMVVLDGAVERNVHFLLVGPALPHNLQPQGIVPSAAARLRGRETGKKNM